MSGAFVIDRETNEICGHILAYSVNNCWAYSSPMSETRSDIISEMGERETADGAEHKIPRQASAEEGNDRTENSRNLDALSRPTSPGNRGTRSPNTRLLSDFRTVRVAIRVLWIWPWPGLYEYFQEFGYICLLMKILANLLQLILSGITGALVYRAYGNPRGATSSKVTIRLLVWVSSMFIPITLLLILRFIKQSFYFSHKLECLLRTSLLELVLFYAASLPISIILQMPFVPFAAAMGLSLPFAYMMAMNFFDVLFVQRGLTRVPVTPSRKIPRSQERHQHRKDVTIFDMVIHGLLGVAYLQAGAAVFSVTWRMMR